MKILFISHDANRAGAQLFLLNVMQYLQQKGYSLHLLLLDEGSLMDDFAKICPISIYPKSDIEAQPKKMLKRAFSKILPSKNNTDKNIETFFTELNNQNFDLVYANTIATAWVLPQLCSFIKAPLFSHIHELEFSIQLYSQKNDRNFMFEQSDTIIACSKAVAQNIENKHGVSTQKLAIIHSFVDNETVLSRSQNTDKEAIKQKYHLPTDAFLIGGCGNAEWRKGIDIFIQLANQLTKNTTKKIHFVWIGVKKEGEYYEQISYDLAKMGLQKKVSFIAQTPEAIELINCLDIFTITSREDPFPLVMLEAALMQKTMLGFEKTGGCGEFIEADAGALIPYLDINAMSKKILELTDNQALANNFGQNAKEKVLKFYSFENSILKIEDLLNSLY